MNSQRRVVVRQCLDLDQSFVATDSLRLSSLAIRQHGRQRYLLPCISVVSRTLLPYIDHLKGAL